MEYISKTFRLDEQVIAWLEKLRATHGSYNKGLRLVAFPGAVGEKTDIAELTTRIEAAVKQRMKRTAPKSKTDAASQTPNRVIPRFAQRKY